MRIYAHTYTHTTHTRAHQLCAKLQEPLVSCGVGAAQMGAAVALNECGDHATYSRDIYQKRRDIVVDTLKEYKLYSYTPNGAFYILVDISSTKMDARDFAIRLLKEKHVAVAPGNTFGTNTSHLLRVSFATSDEHVREGMRRLGEFVLEQAQARA